MSRQQLSPSRWLVVAGVCVLSMVALSESFAAGVSFAPATPYTAAGDAAGFFNTTWPITIEDFEDNSVDPFITDITGAILPPFFQSGSDNLTDSVDGDDGVIDGNGNGGHSFFNAGRSIHITFAQPVIAAGLVWTDGEPVSAGVMLEVFDADGMSLGTFDYMDLADDNITGETAEDRFIGASSSMGIGSLLVTNLPGGSGIEIDHVQWHMIPEPTSIAMLIWGILGVSSLRRRR